MRLWAKQLIPYLPNKNIISQWRECCCIARNIAVNGTPNHILVNRIMDYPITHFMKYTLTVISEMERRGYHCNVDRFLHWMAFEADDMPSMDEIYNGLHDLMYLRICMANLLEKFIAGGISDKDWDRLCFGYEKIVGREYVLGR